MGTGKALLGAWAVACTQTAQPVRCSPSGQLHARSSLFSGSGRFALPGMDSRRHSNKGRANLPAGTRAQRQGCAGTLRANMQLQKSMLRHAAGALLSRGKGRLIPNADKQFRAQVVKSAGRGVTEQVQGGKRGLLARSHQYPSIGASSGKPQARTAGQSPWGRMKQGMRLPSGLTSTRLLPGLI